MYNNIISKKLGLGVQFVEEEKIQCFPLKYETITIM
jgi:hypothetical protein